MAASVVQKYENLIRGQAKRVWQNYAPVACCDPDDVAQEVLVILWQRRERIAAADNPMSFIARAASSEARRAIKRLCRDHLRFKLLSIDASAALGQVFYGGVSSSDGWLD